MQWGEADHERGGRAARGASACTAVVALLSAACATDNGERRAEGEHLYITECAQCHQVDGRGYADVYPSLARSPIVGLHSPEPMIAIILDGRAAMPGFRDQLTIQELAALISYLRGAWQHEGDAVSRTQVN